MAYKWTRCMRCNRKIRKIEFTSKMSGTEKIVWIHNREDYRDAHDYDLRCPLGGGHEPVDAMVELLHDYLGSNPSGDSGFSPQS